MIDMQQQAYTGVDNLEVMQEAVNYNRYLLDMVRRHAPNGGRVLDFGAGAGQFAAPLRQAGMNVTACEPDHGLQQRLRSQGLSVASSTEDLDDGSFDYIYTLNVLEHIEDDTAVLRKLREKLKSNGRLLIYVPAFQVLYTSMDAKVNHVRRYTRGMLVQRVKAAGFRIERAGYADSMGFFATLLFKFIGNRQGDVNPAALKLYDRAVFPFSRMLNVLVHPLFGKNLFVVATKAETAQ